MSVPNPQVTCPEYDDTVEMQIGELEMQALHAAAAISGAGNSTETLPATVAILRPKPVRSQPPVLRQVIPSRPPVPSQSQLRFAVLLSIAAIVALMCATVYLADLTMPPVDAAEKPASTARPSIVAASMKPITAAATTPVATPLPAQRVPMVTTQVVTLAASGAVLSMETRAPATAATSQTSSTVPEELRPLQFRNPFDWSEVFEFPPGTSRAEARAAVAEVLVQRARDRQGAPTSVPRRKTADKDTSPVVADAARRS